MATAGSTKNRNSRYETCGFFVPGRTNAQASQVNPTGSKICRMSYTQANGKENCVSFGASPAVSLAMARDSRISSIASEQGG